MRFNFPHGWRMRQRASLAEPGDAGPRYSREINHNPSVCRIPETAVTFVQLDDLKPEQLDRVRPAGFIIFSTSPQKNDQAWIAVSAYKEILFPCVVASGLRLEPAINPRQAAPGFAAPKISNTNMLPCLSDGQCCPWPHL